VALEDPGIGRAALELREDGAALGVGKRAARALQAHRRGLGLQQEAIDRRRGAPAEERGERQRGRGERRARYSASRAQRPNW